MNPSSDIVMCQITLLMVKETGAVSQTNRMSAVVKPKPECRHCGNVLSHSLARCSRCGKRSWLNLILGGVGRRY